MPHEIPNEIKKNQALDSSPHDDQKKKEELSTFDAVVETCAITIFSLIINIVLYVIPCDSWPSQGLRLWVSVMFHLLFCVLIAYDKLAKPILKKWISSEEQDQIEIKYFNEYKTAREIVITIMFASAMALTIGVWIMPDDSVLNHWINAYLGLFISLIVGSVFLLCVFAGIWDFWSSSQTSKSSQAENRQNKTVVSEQGNQNNHTHDTIISHQDGQDTSFNKNQNIRNLNQNP